MGKTADAQLTESRRPARVVVLVDASPDALHALEAAAELAAQHQVPLLAVSVEEPERARSSGYPFASEVGAVSGAIRPIDEAVLGRRRDSGPASIRRLIDRTAGEMGVAWEMVFLQGRFVEQVLALAAPGDWLMLGRVGWSARIGRRLGSSALRLARRAHGAVQICSAAPSQARGRTAVLVEDAGSAASLLGVAAARSRTARRSLVVLLAPAVGEPDREQLADAIAQRSGVARIRALASMGTGDLLRALAEERAVELVVGRGGWLDSPAADRLMTHWRMPVLVAPAS